MFTVPPLSLVLNSLKYGSFYSFCVIVHRHVHQTNISEKSTSRPVSLYTTVNYRRSVGESSRGNGGIVVAIKVSYKKRRGTSIEGHINIVTHPTKCTVPNGKLPDSTYPPESMKFPARFSILATEVMEIFSDRPIHIMIEYLENSISLLQKRIKITVTSKIPEYVMHLKTDQTD